MPYALWMLNFSFLVAANLFKYCMNIYLCNKSLNSTFPVAFLLSLFPELRIVVDLCGGL